MAAKRADQVPVEERQRRSAVLRRLSLRRRDNFYKSHLGKTARVLFEDPKPGSWPAYTDNYIRVVVPRQAERDENLANRSALVELKQMSADVVEGEIVEMLD